MESCLVGSQKPHRSNRGGVRHLERLLGLRQDGAFSTDAVFVSLDIETDADRRRLHASGATPEVRQLGFACLDTRSFRCLSESSDLRALISTQIFQLKVKSTRTSKKAARRQKRAQERPWVFTPNARSITQGEVSAIFQKILCIQDKPSNPSGRLRNIVLVCHSIKEDIKIIQLLGIDIFSIAPALTIFDTHILSRYILPPYHPSLFPEPMQYFSLAGVLAEFSCRPDRSEFHTAGNDAAYTIYAMIFLAVEEGKNRKNTLNSDEASNLGIIDRALSEALERGFSNRFSKPQLTSEELPPNLGTGLRDATWEP
jgi:hypothetical protein